ncbi:hypothetical protein CI102_15035 [Trichoderma harzianum]|nr:hypothetical protein CI102_15035 [Trichoderma harzianum]
MPFWDENAAYCPLIGQKPPPPPRVDGSAMHIYNICMLMQRHNRKKATCQGGAYAGTMFFVPCTSFAPFARFIFFYLDTPRLLSHSWSGQRACLLVAYARRQCSSPRGEAPKLRLCNTGLLGKSSAPPCEKPQRKHASRQVRCGNG